MKAITSLLTAFLLLLGVNSFGQTEEVVFTKITGAGGIQMGKVNAITRDKEGFVWFSDQNNRSIVRYDGSSMTRFAHAPDKPNTLGGYYPEALDVDNDGNIWIGFYGQGLDRYNPYTNTFTHFEHDEEDAESLVNDVVSWVLADSEGYIWVGTNGGLDRLDPNTGKFDHYVHDPDDSTSLSGNEIRKVYQDRQGTIWVGAGFAYSSHTQGGLNRFQPETNNFKRYVNDPNDPTSLAFNKPRAIFEDSRGNFWVGTEGNVLHLMDREKGTFKRFVYDPKKPDQLAAPPVTGSVNLITFITEDAAGHLWIGSDSDGLHRYNPKTEKIEVFGREHREKYPDNSGWVIYADPSGLMWVANQEQNLYEIDIYALQIPKIKEKVNAVLQDSDSIIWKDTDLGLIRQNLNNGGVKIYRHESTDDQTLSSDEITAIEKDHLGYLWVGTKYGLNRLDPVTNQFVRYINDPNDSTSIGHYNITDIYEDTSGRLWITTIGGGLNQYDRSTDSFICYTHSPIDNNSLRSDALQNIVEDNEGFLWIGHFDNAGVEQLNPETGVFKSHLIGQTIMTLLIDKKGVLWIGTGNGLFYFDQPNQAFKTIELLGGVGSMVEDNEGNLWVGSSSGIYKVVEDRSYFIRYNESNGVFPGPSQSGGWSPNAALNSADGKIYMSTDAAYSSVTYVFDPKRMVHRPDSSILVFTDLVLGNQSEPKVNKSLLNEETITLSHDQNVFGVRFSEIEFRNPSENFIEYRLVGYDVDWSLMRPGDIQNYYRVPPGQYDLTVRSSNSSSGSESSNSLKVIIKPPWWLTWPAYIFYGVLFFIGVFVVHTIQKARVIRKERERTKDRELAQAKEIEMAYKELKTTQTQLIHSEKMASLGELTAGIAHEIQNPLNFVNNFSDVNKELLEELKEAVAKSDHDEVRAIIDDLIDNEDKVTHHGKRAEDIVKSMLQHSRGGEGIKELMDINALCDEYLRLAYHGFRAKDQSFNADFKAEFDESLPKVEVVPQDIGRVLLNLINNAFQAVKDVEKPLVAVYTSKTDDTIEIKVTDNGPGIPDEIKDKIFQPFFTTKPTGEGTGLGLSMSYDIVTKGHGGELIVESKSNDGSIFTILLPVL